MLRTTITSLLLLTLVSACGTEVSVTTPPPTIPPQVAQLADWIEGNFNSNVPTNHAEFQDISIHAVRIWPEKLGARWIYFEQVAPDKADLKSSRQFLNHQLIYEVTTGTHADIVVRKFELPSDSIPPAGTYKNPNWFQGIDSMFILPLGGCTTHFIFNKEKKAFTGNTIGNGCKNSNFGATYQTTESTVSAQEIRILNRGWNSKDTQVWGPLEKDGPIKFTRLNN